MGPGLAGGGGIGRGSGSQESGAADGIMSLKPPRTAAVMMPRNSAMTLRIVADHSRW